ncbi:MAG: molybdopterin oxidoreductase family protein [Myxococcota bacterium]
MASPRIHHRACHLCEAICGLTLEIEDTGSGERIRSIRGDESDPLSRGYMCPKGSALADLHEDPDRLRNPVRRVGSGDDARWEPMRWDEAIEEVATRLHEVQKAHGNDAVGTYLGNPTAHNLGGMLFGPPLLRALRTKNRFSATSADQLPHMFAAYQMFGHQLLLPVPDVDRTDHLIILGANPLASNGSILTAPGMRKRLQAIREAGGKVVVVDPRRTETAKQADAHHFLRPASDPFFLLAFLHELFRRGAVDLGRLAPHCDGLDELRALAKAFPPERAAGPTGMAAADIVALVDGFLSAERPVLYGRMGTCTQVHGGLNGWLLYAINAVAGRLDRPGGMMFPTPAVDLTAQSGRGSFGRWRSRVRDLPEFGGELPVAALAEEIATPGEKQIRALLTFAGNPVLSTPNGRRLDAALEGLDFMVAIDPFVNETSRHAHVILPPCSPLERAHYDLVFHAFAVRNTAKWSQPAFALPAGSKTDAWILASLRLRLETLRAGPLSKKAVTARALRIGGERAMMEAALRTGPYGHGLFGRSLGGKPAPGELTLGRLEKAPHGIDLGPLMPQLPDRLPSRGGEEGRVDLAPKVFLEDVERLVAAETEATPGLRLIGRRQLRSNNSWMHNAPRLMRGKDRCTLLVHPSDAEARGLATGDVAKVRSRVGEVEAPVEVTPDVMAGVVSLPHGFGHGRPGVRLGVAARQPGVSMNDLTDGDAIDPLTGNAVLNGVPVEVERVEAAE